MALISTEDAKAYLRVDSSDEDATVGVLLASAIRLCIDIARLTDEKWEVIDSDADKPDAEFSEAGVCIVNDHAHHGVVDGVPDPGHAQQNTGKGRAESKGVGHVKHQEGTDQIADRVLAHSTDAEGVLLTCRKPISLCCLGSHLSFLLQNLNFLETRGAHRLSDSYCNAKTGGLGEGNVIRNGFIVVYIHPASKESI